ncbi:prephenate dehydrogenase [Anaerolinea sp.]|uniref:prephenate dehydrogenase n=1 Tax=Anaerolinea sp. TaxID=1872519 RepID=UPI002ACDF691|nr:prephenate dehydrogenase [Anaerolinea sp.]
MSTESEEDFFRSLRIAIVGLGLMGGSLALALRGRVRAVLGVDTHAPTRQRALEGGAVDAVSADPVDLLPQADVVVLATPVQSILHLLERLPDLHPGRAVVLDVGSTKREILAAMAHLPERFDPLGGHPMCGKEYSSFEHAEADLYQGAAFALCPLERTSVHARRVAESLAQAVGARPLWLDAETHDRWVAATSHLPYLLASALASSVPPQAAPLAGPGYRSTSRLASQSADLMLEVLASNRDHLLASLRRAQLRLDLLAQALEAEDWQSLRALLAESAHQRESLLNSHGEKPHESHREPRHTPAR